MTDSRRRRVRAPGRRAVVVALQCVLVADLVVLAHVLAPPDLHAALDPLVKLLLPHAR